MQGVPPVRVEGLTETRSRLKAVRTEYAKNMHAAEKRAAEVVSVAAAAKAPRGKRPLPKNRRKRLHESVKPIVRGTRVYVGALYSQAPHANVNHWGGTIRPRGVPIRFQRRAFILNALAENRDAFVAALAYELDKVIHEAGFR